MMHDFQNALYINDTDVTNAVIFDRQWLLATLEARDLRIRAVTPPEIRGFQWVTEIVPGRGSISLPSDDAPFGRMPPPVGATAPHEIR
jgi:hypothetical protein